MKVSATRIFIAASAVNAKPSGSGNARSRIGANAELCAFANSG